MPNLKIYVDRSIASDRHERLASALPQLRDLLCTHLNAPPSACQLAIVSVIGLPDQPQANVELAILPKEDRPIEVRRSLATVLQKAISEALETHAAVRIAMLDAPSYVTLR